MPTNSAASVVEVQPEPIPVQAENATNVDVKPTDVSGKLPEKPELDEYGRDAAERTVELSSVHAEAVDHEVQAGRHKTYDDALAYVIGRGLAEIKRQRDAAIAIAQKTQLKLKRDSYTNLLSSNPALIANSDFVATMLKDLGVVQPKSVK